MLSFQTILFTPYKTYLLEPITFLLCLKTESCRKIGVLVRRIPCNLGKQGQGKRLGHPYLLGRPQGYLGHGKARTAAVVERGLPRSGAYRGIPVQTAQAERSGKRDIRRVGPFTVLLQPVVATDVRVPVHGQEAEVIPNLRFVDMLRGIAAEMEIFPADIGARLEIRPFAETVIGNRHTETFCG